MSSRRVEIDYGNWRGARRTRIILPTGRVAFENNEWHPNTQWLLEAVDEETGKIKDFALSCIHSWKELPK